jgi:hypothetical protein
MSASTPYSDFVKFVHNETSLSGPALMKEAGEIWKLVKKEQAAQLKMQAGTKKPAVKGGKKEAVKGGEKPKEAVKGGKKEAVKGGEKPKTNATPKKVKGGQKTKSPRTRK